MDARLGATVDGGSTHFLVWAPAAERVALRLLGPAERTVPLEARGGGYHGTTVEDAPAGSRYVFELGPGRRRSDPASRSQPEGVHGPSEVARRSFPWTDPGWSGLALEDIVLYEIHVGTFTAKGSFEAILPRLPDLAELGVTALELMPVAQFPGTRNWGYDGVFPFAAQASYGGLEGLRRLVDACHARGLACVLDVVCNHVGPEGNHLADFGPYFTDAAQTPWGPAINMDGPGSDGVRRFFLESARHWVEDAHVDGLRLDSIHMIADRSARPFLEELADAVHAAGRRLGRRVHVIAEDPRNDPRVVRSREAGGLGLDAVWSDDVHHALHAFLTGERSGYYADFGAFDQVRTALADGVVFTGQPSSYRGCRRGRPFDGVRGEQIVVYAQNHDQVGNRARSDRLSALVPFEAQKLAAALVLLSPYTPLLFMGEEYGESAPFLFFTSHGDPDLAEAVRRGRQSEFASFGWDAEIPDPQAESTFERSRLRWDSRSEGLHAALLAYHRALLELRRSHPALRLRDREHRDVWSDSAGRVLALHRWADDAHLLMVVHLGEGHPDVQVPAPSGAWRPLLDSAEASWGGPRAASREDLPSHGSISVPLEPWEALVLARQGAA